MNPTAQRLALLLALPLSAALPAAAQPLAPFLLHHSGPAELKYTGYMARSADGGAPGTLQESSFAAG